MYVHLHDRGVRVLMQRVPEGQCTNWTALSVQLAHYPLFPLQPFPCFTQPPSSILAARPPKREGFRAFRGCLVWPYVVLILGGGFAPQLR